MNISDEVVLFITSISKNYYKKKEFSLDNSNIKIFRTNDTFIEINLYEFISRCKKYLLEQGYGISIVECSSRFIRTGCRSDSDSFKVEIF